MSPRLQKLLFAASLATLLAVASEAHAALVTWDVDSSQSFMRLNIPDQSFNIDGTPAIMRIRNNQNTSAWSDGGGRRAFLEGQVVTNYNGNSISFLSGQHNLYALESGSFRPNPASYNTNATTTESPDGTYSNTSGAPAAFAGIIRADTGGLPFNVGFFAIRNVMLDIASGSVPVTAGTFGGSTTSYGIDSLGMDLDGLSALIIGQPLPDLLDESMVDLVGVNTVGGSIDDLGGALRLTYLISTPIIIDLEGYLITASLTGQIVAYAVPEPSSLALAGCAALSLCWAGRRRFVRHHLLI